MIIERHLAYMATLAQANFNRSLCNWRPNDRAVATFRPPVETWTERSRSESRQTIRSELGKPLVDRRPIPGMQILAMNRDHAKSEITFELVPDETHMELTSKGPVLLDQDGRRIDSFNWLTIAVNTPQASTTDAIDAVKKIIACAALKESAFSTFSLGFMELFNTDRWPFQRCTNPVHTYPALGIACFLVLTTTRAFDGFINLKRKKGWKFVFLPPADMVRHGKLVYVGGMQLETRLSIQSDFKIDDTKIRIETERFDATGRIITSMHSDHLGYDIGELSRTKDWEAAKKMHRRWIRRLGIDGIDFVNRLVAERTLRKID